MGTPRSHREINAYFPLSDHKQPALDILLNKWKPIRRNLEAFARKINKAYLFTEYGYLSVDAAASRHWELEQYIHSRNINEEAQATAMKAILQSFAEAEHWLGAFLWKWFPGMQGHEGYPERDYTPQGKLGEGVLSEMYYKLER